MNAADGEYVIKTAEDGGVELYYDNAKKFATTSQGCDIGFSDGNVRFMAANGSANIYIDVGDSEIKMWDNSKIVMGAGSDLSLYHDGSHSYIKDDGTGDLRIVSNDLYFYTASGTETQAYMEQNGAVGLYYDNSRKLRTTSTGGVLSGSWLLTDDNKMLFGTGSDLSIFHDGTHSYIENITGSLKFATGQVEINKSTTETMAKFVPDGAVEIYYDNSKKAESYSSGLLLDGTVLKFENVSSTPSASNNTHIYAHDGLLKLCGGSGFQFEEGGFTRWKLTSGALHPHGTTYNNLGNSTNRVGNAYIQTSVDLVDNAEIRIGDSDDLKLYHDGSNSYIKDDGTGNLIIRNGNDDAIICNTDGSVDLFYDNSKKFELISAGCRVTSGNSLYLYDNGTLNIGNSNDLALWHDGTNSYISNATGDFIIRGVDGKWLYLQAKSGEDSIICKEDGAVEIFYDDAKRFETSSAGCTVTGTCTATAFAGDGSSLTGISSSASGGGSDAIFWENGTNVTTNYTITNGKNAMSAGPITIDSGVTVTIGSGEAWTIV
jgi:hypothetical protein